MAQAGNYQAGSLLDDDIERFRKEFEVEICRSDGDPESDLHRRQEECKKNPGHVTFISEPEFTIEHLPLEWRNPWVYEVIRRLARCVVYISVTYTSPKRPDGYSGSDVRGLKWTRFGTGNAVLPFKNLFKPPQPCSLKNCKVSHPHNVTPEFYVDTASHVVFDSSEAEQTEIRFFLDSEDGTKGKAEITAHGLRMLGSYGTEGELCRFVCVSHNLNILNLCHRLDSMEKMPEQPFTSSANEDDKTSEPPLRDTNSKKRKPLVVIVSHPHGCSKHVSTGYLTGLKPIYSTMENHVRSLWNMLIFVAEMIFFEVSPDITMRQFYRDNNVSITDFLINFTHDITRLLTCPLTVNEIAHKMLLAMWEKTTSNSTLSGQVSAEELTEIALSVVNDINSPKSSEVKRMICMLLLSFWKKVTSDSRFSRQPCREEFSEICKHVVNDIIRTNSLTLKEAFEKFCSTLNLPADTKLPSSESKGKWSAAEASLYKNLTLGQALERYTYDLLNDPSCFINGSQRVLYSTDTCPGSSGAPVFLFYDEANGEVDFEVLTHCGANKGANISSVGLTINTDLSTLNFDS